MSHLIGWNDLEMKKKTNKQTNDWLLLQGEVNDVPPLGWIYS